MSIYVTSDLHLNHDQPFVYAARGYNSVEAMNKDLIRKINTTIKWEDELYILGDGFLNCLPEVGCSLINSIDCGFIHYIIGNHDTDSRVEAVECLCPNVVSIDFGARLRYKGQSFYLSHYPTLCANSSKAHPVYNLCGHLHTNDRWVDWDKGVYHVEVDAHDGYPVLFDDIIAEIKEKSQ